MALDFCGLELGFESRGGGPQMQVAIQSARRGSDHQRGASSFRGGPLHMVSFALALVMPPDQPLPDGDLGLPSDWICTQP